MIREDSPASSPAAARDPRGVPNAPPSRAYNGTGDSPDASGSVRVTPGAFPDFPDALGGGEPGRARRPAEHPRFMGWALDRTAHTTAPLPVATASRANPLRPMAVATAPPGNDFRLPPVRTAREGNEHRLGVVPTAPQRVGSAGAGVGTPSTRCVSACVLTA